MNHARKAKHGWILTLFFSIVSVLYLYPIVLVVINSFKKKAYISRYPFRIPRDRMFVGLENYVRGLEKTGFLPAFGWTVLITVCSVALIILCCSMCAWYISRVKTRGTKIIYTLFMFTGFVKSIPLEIEEASMIDGCTPLQCFFRVVLPVMKPTCITIAILDAMWIWNDYLLPVLVLDTKKYKTISIAIQYLKGGYGSIDMGAMMGVLVLSIIPIIVFYLFCQRYIIEGVVAGAVKG